MRTLKWRHRSEWTQIEHRELSALGHYAMNAFYSSSSDLFKLLAEGKSAASKHSGVMQPPARPIVLRTVGGPTERTRQLAEFLARDITQCLGWDVSQGLRNGVLRQWPQLAPEFIERELH